MSLLPVFPEQLSEQQQALTALEQAAAAAEDACDTALSTWEEAQAAFVPKAAELDTARKAYDESRKKLKTAFLQIFGFLGRNFGHLIQIEMKIVDVFAHQRQKMKSFATFRRFGLNLVAVNASAEGASENFRASFQRQC